METKKKKFTTAFSSYLDFENFNVCDIVPQDSFVAVVNVVVVVIVVFDSPSKSGQIATGFGHGKSEVKPETMDVSC